jgi:hypothetical protein
VTEHVEYSWAYPVTPLDMFRMVTRLEHLEQKAEYLGHRGHKMLELRERGGKFRSVTQRQIDTKLPVWAPKFIAPRNTITQWQVWAPPRHDGGRRWDIQIEVAGLPITIVGMGALTSIEYTATRCEISLDVRCTMPIFGRRVERVVTEQMRTTMEGEHEFRLLWLQRDPHRTAHF